MMRIREFRAYLVEMTDDNGDTEEFIRFGPGNWFIKIDGSWDPMSASGHLEEALNEELRNEETVSVCYLKDS